MADHLMGLFTYVGVGVVIGGLVGVILAVAGDPPTIVTGIVAGVGYPVVAGSGRRHRRGPLGEDAREAGPLARAGGRTYRLADSHHYGCVISSGCTHSSNCSSVTPACSAAARSVVPSRCAWCATSAAWS